MAESLKDWSPRPPTSVTRPILIVVVMRSLGGDADHAGGSIPANDQSRLLRNEANRDQRAAGLGDVGGCIHEDGVTIHLCGLLSQ